MKPEIIMCNYYGMCDEENNPVGHAVKVTNEYSEVLKEVYTVKLVASPCIAKKSNSLHFKEIKNLRYNISIFGNGIGKRITDKFKLLANIYIIFKEKGALFFYQVDFFFFFYISFFYRTRRDRKIICLIYHQDFTGGRLSGILQSVYKRALRKIDGVIYTQAEHPIEHPNSIWIPDFFYSEKQYTPYQKLPKKERVVCVGTMNRYKQLEKLVEEFAQTEFPLVIAGRFDDNDRYHKLLSVKTDNVVIQNRNLSYEEYLELIATSKYSILPYDMEQYINRSSGVLLESIYVGSIPIAPNSLLEQNCLMGIGYESLSELWGVVGLLNKNYEFDFQEVYKKYNGSNFVDFMDTWIIKG